MDSSHQESTESASAIVRRLTAPVVLLLLISGLVIGGLVWYGAREIDRVAIQSSVHLARSAVDGLRRELTRMAKDYSWWDEALLNLFVERDMVWAEDTIGSYARWNLGWSTSFVLDEDDRTLYGWVEGTPFGDNIDALEWFSGGLPALVEEARSAPMFEPEAATGLLVARGVAHVVSVSAYTHETPSRAQAERRTRPVLVISRAVDGELLADWSANYLLDDLELVESGTTAVPARLELISVDGTPAGALTWVPDPPGRRLLMALLPGVAAILSVMGALFWLSMRRTRRAAAQIEDGAKRLAAQNVALERSEHRVQTIVDNVAEGIITVGSDGVVESFNPAASALFGREREEAVGLEFDHLFDCAEVEDLVAKLRAGLFPAAPAVVREATGIRSDNTRFPAELATAAMRLGDERMVVAVVRDITTRKHGEPQMRQAKEAAEEANRAKSEFLAHISHELRTLLNAAMGFAELFQSEAFGALGNEKYKEYAAHIYGSGRHLLELINDILELSRAEAGKLTLAESDFEMPGILVAALEMVRKDATEAGIELDTEIALALPKLRGDERRIRQVAINLLSNAVKFTPRGGCISVRADLDEEAGHRLTVKDTGVGIAQEDIERALKPFVQVDSTLTRRYIGAGIGLPLSQRLVELHGGALEIESALDKGTTVTARFPAERTVEDTPDRRGAARP